MAVTTTPQMILDAAYAKSMKNKPGTIATETTELLQVVIRALRGIYAFAARVNPTFFAVKEPVNESTGTWPRPANAESVFRIEGQVPVAAAAVAGANTGNGTVGSIAATRLGVAETITLTATAVPTVFSVVGSVTGALADATVGTAYTSSVIGFLISAGSAAFVENDSFTIAVTLETAEVVLVPFDDRKAEEGKPSLYAFGQTYHAAGNATDPLGSLDFFYSKRPSDPASLGATLDELWTEQFNELLVLETAIYLAVKDAGSGREAEMAALKLDRDHWAKLFVAFLEHADANERRRYGHIRRINTSTLVPLSSILAGGTAAVG